MCVKYFFTNRDLVESLLKVEKHDTFQCLMMVYTKVRKETLTGYRYYTPLRMLIKYMPGV